MIDLPLGKQTEYSNQYDKTLLVGIPRTLARSQIGIDNNVNFNGYDIWNCYEISWLNRVGKPEVRVMRFIVPCSSENIIESKSVKLYLNSFNGSKFADENEVMKLMKQDFSDVAGLSIDISMFKLEDISGEKLQNFDGESIDNEEINVDDYNINNQLLRTENQIVAETLYSNLLKSNCLVTNQPDWASVYINYKGPKICRKSLLKYVISFRNQNEFHEQCVEHIYSDIMQKCKPAELIVYAKYTRRGGVDINPYRSSVACDVDKIDKLRDIRQ